MGKKQTLRVSEQRIVLKGIRFQEPDDKRQAGRWAVVFRGLAVPYNFKFRAWDPDKHEELPTTIARGAFAEAVEKASKIKLLWLHDDWQVVGRVIELRETGAGLEVVGGISNTRMGKDVAQLIRDGAVDELSIGFVSTDTEYITNSETREVERVIKRGNLLEISIVPWGAAKIARIDRVLAKKSEDRQIFTVVPFQDLPLADRDRPWDAAAAERRVREWAGGVPDLSEMDFSKYRQAFVWYDSSKPENVTSYKLQIADVEDDMLVAVPRGIFAAAAAVQGARGGVDIPEADVDRVKNHLARYYRKMDLVPPWEQEADDEASDRETQLDKQAWLRRVDLVLSLVEKAAGEAERRV